MQQRTWTEFWADWCQRYATVFRLTADADMAMLAAWGQEFDAANFSQGELTLALDHVCRESVTDRWTHYQQILKYVREYRKAGNTGAPRLRSDERGTCELCSDTGQVSGLPMPSEVVDGDWRGTTTCAVICRCIRGKFTREAREERKWDNDETKRRALRTISDYEAVNPGWREQQHLAVEARKAKRRSEFTTRAADKERGAIRTAAGPVARIVGEAVQRTKNELVAASASDGDESIPF